MSDDDRFTIRRIGREQEPLVCLDNFAPDPEALRNAAIAARFTPADQAYPGMRALLPSDYFLTQRPLIEHAIRECFDLAGNMNLIDASFSIVTTPPKALSVKQRIPHCDAHARNRIALIHYLSPVDSSGTAFFRHGSTGFETIDDDRAPEYFDRLSAELRENGAPPLGYITDDTALFERTTVTQAYYNRAFLYRSCLLHSGAIAPTALLSPDPAIGRLTITGFLIVE